MDDQSIAQIQKLVEIVKQLKATIQNLTVENKRLKHDLHKLKKKYRADIKAILESI